MAEAIILGYRRGSNTQYPQQVLLKIIGVSARDAYRFLAKKVVYKDKHGNVYKGRIVRKHGRRNPVVLAVFEPNLPGQAIGGRVEIVE